MWRAVLCLSLLEPVAAVADEVPEGEIASLQADFDYGKYLEVLVRANTRIDRGGLEDGELLLLHKLAAVSAFNLHRTEEAQRHVAALLRLDPDYSLDPFVYPPAAVSYVEKQRRSMAPELDRIRQDRRAREAAAKRATEERALLAREAEAQRRKLEEMSRRVTVRNVEKRSLLVNFVPFGAGQFQEGRAGVGAGFAIAEGVLAVTSIVAYFAYGSLFETRTIPVENRFPGAPDAVETGIPRERATEARIWRVLKIGAGLGFYGTYAAGVVDALLHHEDQVITTHVETPPPLPAVGERGAPSRAPRLGLYARPDGFGAGLTVRF